MLARLMARLGAEADGALAQEVLDCVVAEFLSYCGIPALPAALQGAAVELAERRYRGDRAVSSVREGDSQVSYVYRGDAEADIKALLNSFRRMRTV